ncbi:MAG TPA: galactokinase family protein, partial [Candidatus Acidoferrum sp.]
MPTAQIYSVDHISERFQQRFREKCKVFRAPGRVNLIGEHTDYNQGYVLPAAIDFSCWVAVAARDDKKLSIYSENFSDEIAADLSSSNSWPRKGWAAYPLGVA